MAKMQPLPGKLRVWMSPVRTRCSAPLNTSALLRNCEQAEVRLLSIWTPAGPRARETLAHSLFRMRNQLRENAGSALRQFRDMGWRADYRQALAAGCWRLAKWATLV